MLDGDETGGVQLHDCFSVRVRERPLAIAGAMLASIAEW
jgi:hypothetical protein